MKTSSLLSEVKKVLLLDWDPIGIQNMPDATTEYDGYALGIHQLLVESRSVEEIYAHLRWIVVDRMGLDDNEAHTMTVAKSLVSLSRD
jgi:hypothetical protein